jgi:hypothetical protein
LPDAQTLPGSQPFAAPGRLLPECWESSHYHPGTWESTLEHDDIYIREEGIAMHRQGIVDSSVGLAPCGNQPHSIARRLVFIPLLVALVAAWLPHGAGMTAQAPGKPLDLAAMALAPEDVPAGYVDDYGEWLIPAPAIAELVLGDAVPAGLDWLYQSFYFNPDDGAAIHVFLLAFASPGQATLDAAAAEVLLRPPLPEDTVTGPAQTPGPALGAEPRATTIVTYDTWAAGGPRAEVVAVSFRRDQLIVGVSVERFTDPPSGGIPVADAAATPVVADPTQEELAGNLASILDGRITDVLAGVAPVGTDLALAPAVLPVDQLADDTIPTWGGYKAGIDLLRCGICGEENSLVPFAEVARVGYARGGVLGPLVDGEPQPPFVSVAVLGFASPEDALAVLDAIGQAPNDLPTPIPVPRGSRTITDAPAIAGADATLAYEAALDAEDPQAVVDSAGVVFVQGAWLVFVDVLGGLPADAALAAATDLAAQQAACLAAPAPCTSVTQPATLGAATASR